MDYSIKIFSDIRLKSSSEDGASAIFALLFFVIATVAGVIILAAAATSTGQITALQDTHKSQYEISSAAKVLSGIIGDSKCSVSDDTDGLYAIFSSSISEKESAENGKIRVGARGEDMDTLGDVISGMVVENIDNGGAAVIPSSAISMSINDDEMSDISARIQMDSNYNIRVLIEFDQSSMTLDFSSSISSASTNGHPSEIRWKPPVFSRPGIH